jgi:acyl-CoA reductase-like NAD-dependent aldehyde dehydrogenase
MLTIVLGHTLLGMAYGMVVVQSADGDGPQPSKRPPWTWVPAPCRCFFWSPCRTSRQAILAAFLLSFTLSFDDVVISEFLSGPGVNTLPQVIFGYARRGINPTIYAAATLLIVTVTVVIVSYSVWVAPPDPPLTALRLAELAIEAGIPPGVFNVVPGYGPEAGSPLALHMDVDCIGFTGSTRVGKQIHVMAGQSNLKRAWTELGGKSPNIVFADCPNLDKAVEAAVGSIFFNQGESCNAPSRLFVEASIQDAFLEKAVAMAPKFAPANPLHPDTIMGAIVDKTQMDTVLRYVESGKAQGASLLYGGEQALRDSGGCYVQPTIFAGVKPDMKICCEEIFGPVLSVMAFTDAAEVVRLANASMYGLQAAVWTRDINRAHGIARALRAGTVHVNQYDEDDITVPFGGYKQSGVGRDKSLHAFDKYTETKTTWIRIDSPV